MRRSLSRHRIFFARLRGPAMTSRGLQLGVVVQTDVNGLKEMLRSVLADRKNWEGLFRFQRAVQSRQHALKPGRH